MANLAAALLAGPTPATRQSAITDEELKRAKIAKMQREAGAAQGAVTAQGQVSSAIQSIFGERPSQRLPDDFVGPAPIVSQGEHVRNQLPDLISGLNAQGDIGKIGPVIRALMANSGAGDTFSDAAQAGAGSAMTLSQVRGRTLSRAIPDLDDRSIASVIGTLNKPSFQLVEGPDGQTGRLDTEDPNAVVERVPGRFPGPGGEGSVIEAMNLAGLLGSSGNAEATASRRTHDAKARSLNITSPELDVLITGRNLIGSDVRGYRALPEPLRSEYIRIAQKIALATSGAPAPPGFQVVQ